MANDLEPLIFDLVDWVAREPRSYADLIDAWRTSCPRLTVWEEAQERGLVTRQRIAGQGESVAATPEGLAFISAYRRAA